MPILTGCCCFDSLKAGSRASAFFTVVMAVCNIAIDISSLVRLHYLDKHLEPQQIFLYFPPGIIPLIYIELFYNVVLIALAVVLLIGINYGIDGKTMIYTWIIGVVIDRLYDIFLGIYILAWIGGHRFGEIVYVIPECIVVAVYWLLNFIILIAAILCVVSYWQELMDELYGKQRRLKYYSKLANIRQAALSGNATPYKSYYSSRSMLMLSQSQGTLDRSLLQPLM